MKLLYMIRRPDGLFSIGGQTPRFAKTGKIWKSLGTLRAHLRTTNTDHYRDCSVVTYEMVRVDDHACEVYVVDAFRRSKQRKDAEAECREYEKEKRERLEWERLCAKFGHK